MNFFLLQVFSRVEKLTTDRDVELELWEREISRHEFPQLKYFRVQSVSSTAVPVKMSKRLQHIEKLEIKDCFNHINIVFSSSCFSNLKVFDVQRYLRLTSLMTASTAKILVHLEEMHISGCEMIREIIQDWENREEHNKIIFPKLKKLELKDLFSLMYFFAGNSSLEFPILHIVTIENCPDMKIFSFGDLKTSLLKQVTQDKKDYVCNNDLSEIVGQHHNSMVSLSTFILEFIFEHVYKMQHFMFDRFLAERI